MDSIRPGGEAGRPLPGCAGGTTSSYATVGRCSVSRWRRAGCVGCGFVLLLSGILLGGCAARYYQSTQREPELPINQFLRKQFEVLPPGWTFHKVDASNIWTDTDFTWARWAVASGFRYKVTLETHRRNQISEEIHVFWNPFAAKVNSRPSPSQ